MIYDSEPIEEQLSIANTPEASRVIETESPQSAITEAATTAGETSEHQRFVFRIGVESPPKQVSVILDTDQILQNSRALKLNDDIRRALGR
ncbi:hypothetical protein [Aeoliella sp.]|uniref:hypothetical protein n=1 Tax=Aeoliella sp. TaxID=2795800 RepID=UPI003CCBE196